jgi:uncharacterized iron-regulated membrane protein
MTSSRLQTWAWLHKWSSLVCTVFLLVICITGLPLVFHEEIDDWVEARTYASLPADTPLTDLDKLVTVARQHYPGQIVTSAFVDDDEPQVIVGLAPSWAESENRSAAHFMRFDARTGALLEDSRSTGSDRLSFMDILFELHVDLFAELPGELFLGLMALLFVIAIVSGVVLYQPFTRRLSFGTVRREKTVRVKWLDLHNLLGVVTVCWAFVVGVTGVINELSTPLFGLYMQTDVARMLAPWKNELPPRPAELSSVGSAYQVATQATPGMIVTSIVFPGSPFGSAHHFVLWAKGSTPLTSRLFNPVLVDARTGKLTAVVQMPWYLRTLEVSRPLHFGDYGGLPLKIIWAALDVVTIVVLGSGVYLWLSRRRSPIKARLAELQELAEPS